MNITSHPLDSCVPGCRQVEGEGRTEVTWACDLGTERGRSD